MLRHRMVRSIAVLALVVGALGGCKAAIQQRAMDTTAEIMWRGKGAMEQEGDLDLARAAIPSGIKTAESFYVANPGNRTVIRVLAAGYCGYAGFIQDDWEAAVTEKRFADAEAHAARAAKLFLRCHNYGLELLGEAWKRDIYGDAAGVEALLAKAKRSDAPALLWSAMGLGGAINMMMGDIAVVAHLGKVQAMLERVVELDEGVENGLAHVLLGSIFCGRGEALGGEPARGAAHFDRALELTDGRLLLAKVFRARFCAVAVQDRAAFHAQLVEVMQTSPDIWPEQRLANAIARHKARRYLAHEEEWF